MTTTIEVGDKIQFSTALLKQIDESPERHTITVVVYEIREENGFKVVYLGTDR